MISKQAVKWVRLLDPQELFEWNFCWYLGAISWVCYQVHQISSHSFWFRIASALGQTEDVVKEELLKEELCWRLCQSIVALRDSTSLCRLPIWTFFIYEGPPLLFHCMCTEKDISKTMRISSMKNLIVGAWKQFFVAQMIWKVAVCKGLCKPFVLANNCGLDRFQSLCRLLHAPTLNNYPGAPRYMVEKLNLGTGNVKVLKSLWFIRML